MNGPNQIDIHAKLPDKGKDLECEVMHTEEGYHALCPTCPWTSGNRGSKGSVQFLYQKHLEYIGIPLL